MMSPDPEIVAGSAAAGAALTAYISKDGIEKLLGPTAAYLGDGLKDLVAKRCQQIGRIFSVAERKLGERIEESGSIPPRLLKMIIEDASYFDDQLSAEYFGGLLASSRTTHGRDDRGAEMAQIVQQLSQYQLRFHYFLYSNWATMFKGANLDISSPTGPSNLEIFVPEEAIAKAFDFTEDEAEHANPIFIHTMFGLSARGLVGDHWLLATQQHLAKRFKEAPGGGLLVRPTAWGAELFLWAFRGTRSKLQEYFASELNYAVEGISFKMDGLLATSTPAA